MQSKYPFLIIFLFFISFNLFAQSSNIAEGCAPLEVSFTAPTGVATFFWDFGDNSNSVLSNPEHIFINPGTYTVDFRETQGGAVLGSITITVFEKPVLEITADPTSGCVPLGVAFENNSIVDNAIAISSYQWVFGDGTTPSTVAEPNHTYTDAGSFTVSLALMTNVPNCETTEIFEDFIETSAAPDVNFTTNPSPPSICEGPLTVSFENTSGSTEMVDFNWDFGNGTTSPTFDAADQTYTQDGQYVVTLTGTNDIGCASTHQVPVSVGPPISDFELPDTVCLNETLTITNNSSPGFYLWNFDSNVSSNSTTFIRPTVTFLQEGPTTISLTTSSGGCSSMIEKEIYIQYIDTSFIFSPEHICERPAEVQLIPNVMAGATYEWFTLDTMTEVETFFSDEQSPLYPFHVLDQNPFYIEEDSTGRPFVLYITSDAGCTFRGMEYFHTFGPTAVFEAGPTEGCAPLTVNFTDSSLVQSEIVNWEWHFGTGVVENTDQTSISYTYEDPGDYEAFVIVTNQYGCVDTSYLMPIAVGDDLSPDFEVSETELCPGDTVQLTATIMDENIDAFHFETDNGRSFHCFQNDSPSWSFVTETGSMDIALTVEYNGCYSTINKPDLIQVNGPIARLHYEMDCETPHEFNFESLSQDATTVTWFFGDSTQSNDLNPVHFYDTTGMYMVYLQAENPSTGCDISWDSTKVYVKDIVSSFELDTLLCKGQEYILNATTSQDVDADCHRGYTWFFTNNRPITTSSSTLDFAFGQAGEETVWLETTDINGCRDSSHLDVRIFEMDIDFVQDLERICFPMEVAFEDMSSGDTTLTDWMWDFGDMGTSTAVNPNHTFMNASPPFNDTLIVTLTVQDALGCSNSANSFITYYEPFSDISSISNPQICVGESLDFFATDFTVEGSNLEWTWLFENGDMEIGQTASHTFGQHGLQYVIVNSVEVATGCPGRDTLEVSVHSYPEAALTSSFDGLDIICHPQNALFQDASITNYPLNHIWNFGNGQTANIPNPSTNYAKGTYDLELIVFTDFGCADTTYQTYTLVGPEGDFFLSADEICFGEAITATLQDTVDISSYVWDFNDGTTLVENQDPVSHTYNTGGQQLVTLILKGEEDACSFPLQKSFDIIQPLANFETSDMVSEICIGNSLAFNNTSMTANTWLWDFGDGDTSVEEHPAHQFDTEGLVTVSLVATYQPLGCTDTYLEEFIIQPQPNTMMQGDTICAESAAALSVVNAASNSQYTWQAGSTDVLLDSTGASVQTVDLTESATIILNEITENGCMNSDTSMIVVVPLLEGVEDTLIACLNQPLTLSVPENEFYTYTWTSSNNLSCTDCTMPEFSAAESEVITATPIDIFGLGCSDTTFVFDINVADGNIELPNVFTPNRDGTNDFFDFIVTAGNREDVTIHAFRLYNRWGQLVYENNTPSTGWDGTLNGKLAPSDVYVYYLDVSYLDCFGVVFTGDVTLVR